MKKKILTVLAVCAIAVMVTACGSGNASSTETTESGASAEASSEAGTKAEGEKETDKEDVSASRNGTDDSKAADETEETLDAEIEAQGPGATLEDEMNEEDKNFSDLENSDYNGFASQIVEAVKAKDMNALADLMAYPTYISCVQENDGIVDSKEAFLALDPAVIFDQSLIDAVSSADLGSLEPLVAGVVIGDDTPNIIFNSVDGKLGITGINY